MEETKPAAPETSMPTTYDPKESEKNGTIIGCRADISKPANGRTPSLTASSYRRRT